MVKAQIGDFRCEVDEVLRVRRFENGKATVVGYWEKDEAVAIRLALSEQAAPAIIAQVDSEAQGSGEHRTEHGFSPEAQANA